MLVRRVKSLKWQSVILLAREACPADCCGLWPSASSSRRRQLNQGYPNCKHDAEMAKSMARPSEPNVCAGSLAHLFVVPITSAVVSVRLSTQSISAWPTNQSIVYDRICLPACLCVAPSRWANRFQVEQCYYVQSLLHKLLDLLLPVCRLKPSRR